MEFKQARIWRSAAILIPFGLVSCAQLHHAQLGDIDGRATARNETPFDIKVSETGISTYEAGEIAKGLARTAAQSSAVRDATGVLELFQMGPRTGNPVWNAQYAENIIDLIREKCPNGHVTNLVSIRETRKYPVVSGEIVKVTGLCISKGDMEKNS